MRWSPRDCVAVLVILVAASLLHRGIDTVVGWSLLAIVGGYYGIAIPSLFKIVQNKIPRKEDDNATT